MRVYIFSCCYSLDKYMYNIFFCVCVSEFIVFGVLLNACVYIGVVPS